MAAKQGKEMSRPSLVARLVGVDLRSLALFRIALGTVTLLDLLTRASDLTAHYTDAGVAPRSDLLQAFPWLHEWPLCVHLITGSAWGESLLFVVHAAFAVALLVGYRTRLATAMVWLLTSSLQLRNLYIGHGSDAQLRMMLFWAFFLPLGARYSVDAALRWSAPRREDQQFLSIGTVAIVAQLVIMYLITGYAKAQYAWWQDGTAVGYVFDNEIWGTYVGHFVLRFPAICTLFTYLTLFLELAGPVLLFVPVFFGPLRTAIVAALITMHLCFAIGIRVGIFPFASIAHLLVLLPAWFWHQLLPRLRTAERRTAVVAFHDDCERCSTILVLFRTFFLLPDTPVEALARSGGEATAETVWQVTDGSGHRHTNTEAALYLCHLSPFLWPLASVLRWPPLRRVFERGWHRFGRHAAAGPSLLARLTPRPPVHRQPWAEVVCGVSLAYLLFWNVGVLRDREFTAPPALAWFGNTLFFQQDWRMFSRVDRRTGWVVIPGKLADGTTLDLFALGGPVPDTPQPLARDGEGFTRPDPVIYRVKNYRWLGMTDRLIHLKRGEQQLLAYGRYLCREWNARHEGGRQLDSFEIVFMARDTWPDSRPHPPADYQPEILWRHWCFGAPSGLS